MATVEFQDVTLEVEGKSFLKNVSFRLDAGESMAITGPPGCGRSLVLRLVQGLPGMQKDDRVRLWGDVRINEESVFDMDESGLINLRLRVGSVMGERELVDNMDVDRNISLALTYHSSNDVDDASLAVSVSYNMTLIPEGIVHTWVAKFLTPSSVFMIPKR